jgi:hypothetical protein
MSNKEAASYVSSLNALLDELCVPLVANELSCLANKQHMLEMHQAARDVINAWYVRGYTLKQLLTALQEVR